MRWRWSCEPTGTSWRRSVSAPALVDEMQFSFGWLISQWSEQLIIWLVMAFLISQSLTLTCVRWQDGAAVREARVQHCIGH